MMDMRHFYAGRCRRRAERCTTVFDAVNKATTSANAVSIFVLPTTAGDSAAESDTEQAPDDMSNETPFETAGEFVVEEEVSEADDDTDRNRPRTAKASASTAESAPKKRKK